MENRKKGVKRLLFSKTGEKTTPVSEVQRRYGVSENMEITEVVKRF